MLWMEYRVASEFKVIYREKEYVKAIYRHHVLFIIGDWNVKVGSQETPGVTGKFVLEYRMKQGKG